jgi:molybdopterin biosynthesis enzyme
MRKVPVAEAVGMILCHDLTKIVPGVEKGRAFKKGHQITAADVPLLRDIGKENIFVWDPEPGMVHENEAALRLASAAAGPGISWGEPNQGRVNLVASSEGLLKIDVRLLQQVNSLEGIAFATLHNNQVMKAGTVVAGTRSIPLAIADSTLQEMERICLDSFPLLQIKPFRPLWVGVVTTGSEVYQGRIEDGFFPVLKRKMAPYEARLLGQVIVPDDPVCITDEIRRMIAEGAELVLVTGGMSVDPDDVTPAGIRATGAEVVSYGVPVLPGSMFMLAYMGHVAICGLPGCVMFNKTTIFDLLLPRVFAEDRIRREEIAGLGHGGLCLECADCRYPDCPFGK